MSLLVNRSSYFTRHWKFCLNQVVAVCMHEATLYIRGKIYMLHYTGHWRSCLDLEGTGCIQIHLSIARLPNPWRVGHINHLHLIPFSAIRLPSLQLIRPPSYTSSAHPSIFFSPCPSPSQLHSHPPSQSLIMHPFHMNSKYEDIHHKK